MIPPMSEYYPQAICVFSLDAFYRFFYKVPAKGKDLSVILSLISAGEWGGSDRYYSEPCRLKIEFDHYSGISVTAFLAPTDISEEVLMASEVAHLLPKKPVEEKVEKEKKRREKKYEGTCHRTSKRPS
jgi:hypothetical protein